MSGPTIEARPQVAEKYPCIFARRSSPKMSAMIV